MNRFLKKNHLEIRFYLGKSHNIGLFYFLLYMIYINQNRNQMELLTKATVQKTLIDNADSIKRYGVARLGIFGSVAKDEAHEKSDIDLLVEFKKGKKTFLNFSELSFFLEELFERKVDLLTKESLSPYIGPEILKTLDYVTLN